MRVHYASFLPQTTSLLSTIVGAYDELNDVETSSKAQTWAPPGRKWLCHLPSPLYAQAAKVKIQERKGKILREKRVEYHAFISYGPLTKRHNNRYAPACNGEERVVMEALVSRTRISATPTNSHDCEDYSAPPSCIQIMGRNLFSGDLVIAAAVQVTVHCVTVYPCAIKP